MNRHDANQFSVSPARFVALVAIGAFIAAASLTCSAIAEDQPFAKSLKPFLAKYCVGCHGAKKPKSERRFDNLTGEIANDDDLVDLQDMLDQLTLSEMPPVDSKQPSSEARSKAVSWLTARIAKHHQARKPTLTPPTLRRLNSREYRNTVRDLFRLNMTMFDPTTKFPRDQTSKHLDNNGGALVTSGYLLAQYLDAADQVVNRAIKPLKKPAVQTWTFRDGFRQQPEIDQVHRRTNLFEHMTLYDVIGADKHEGAYGPILAFKEGVPFDGFYEIRLKAEALNRINPYDPKFLGLDPNEPLRLGVVAGDYLVGPLHKPQPIEPLLAEVDLADEAKWYTLRVWLDAGYTPRFVFRNGLMDARNLWSKLLRRYPKQFPKRKRPGIVEARFNAIKYGKLPQIHIHEIEIKGPFFEQWPTPSQQVILGDDSEQILESGEISEQQIRARLTSIATAAYRQPADLDDIERVLAVVKQRRLSGRSSLDAFSDGLKTVLCAPKFLFLEQAESNRLTSTALASRLSYFLWSSKPDQQLLKLASQGELNKPDVLRKQVERMLNDEKSDAFVDGFLDAWLTMRDLGSSPPDRGQFRDYYHYDLGPSMRQETRLFTRHLIEENLSVLNFLDSNFTFADKRLARLYGIKPPKSDGFQRVSLNDRRRGGLLGQASVLTVTANGIDTSPVHRGVWVLENILGSPPSPPPPDVEPLDPDIRGTKSIREQLKKHRSSAVCNDCHRKIDPPGFALESFDPIGRWRDNYRRGVKVDASGILPNGMSFKDIEGLKNILVQQKDQFARALTGKMLSYAVGRGQDLADRPHIDRVLNAISKSDYGFHELITQVVLSEPFRSR